MAVLFEEKNEKLYEIAKSLENVEPSTLSDFGQNYVDNLTILGNRISSIMSGSSDDSWDDKVKDQINKALESIGKSIEDEKKSAEVIKNAYDILAKVKLTVADYVVAYDEYKVHCDKKPKTETETYTGKDGKEHTKYTTEFSEWLKQDVILKKAVPELEKQADTWVEQIKSYFAAYNFTTHEIDTTIYKANTDAIVSYAELLDKYTSEYVEVPYEENVVAAGNEQHEIEEPHVEPTTDAGNLRDRGYPSSMDSGAQPTLPKEKSTEKTTEKTTEKATEKTTEKTTEEPTEDPFWPTQGARYSADLENALGDVNRIWSDANNVGDYILGGVDTIIEAADFLVDGVLDTNQTINDAAAYGVNALLDIGTGKETYTRDEYFEDNLVHVGEDFSENFDNFNNATNFGEGALGLLEGVGRSIPDAVQFLYEGASWVGDKGGDIISNGLDAALDWVGGLLMSIF